MKPQTNMLNIHSMRIIACCIMLFVTVQLCCSPEIFAQAKTSKSKAKSKVPATPDKTTPVKENSIKAVPENNTPQPSIPATPAPPVVETPKAGEIVKVITSTTPTFQAATRLSTNAAARPTGVMGFIDAELSLRTTTGTLWGTLTVPNNASSTATVPFVLILNTNTVFDRNGVSTNNRDSTNNMKFLAEALAKQGIASFRYDTRGVGKSTMALKDEEALDFEKTISDAAGWITLLRKDNRFSTFTIFGYSRPNDYGRESSLVASIVAFRMNADVDGLFCFAPDSRRYIPMIRANAAMAYPKHTSGYVDSLAALLEQGKRFDLKPNDGLAYNLFRPAEQRYVLSLNKYDPCAEFAKVQIPSVVAYGTQDFSVAGEVVQRFAAANPLALCVSFKDMSFNLKNGKEDSATMPLQKYKVPLLPAFVSWLTEYVYSVNIK
jgi:pimeloyl-ACP methyl ester carboxylesterase